MLRQVNCRDVFGWTEYKWVFDAATNRSRIIGKVHDRFKQFIENADPNDTYVMILSKGNYEDWGKAKPALEKAKMIKYESPVFYNNNYNQKRLKLVILEKP